MWTSPQTFEAQIQWMQQVGHIVHYERLLDPAAPRDRPLFTITFDDGWKDNYEYAFPILKKYSAPALIFLATGAIDSGELFWPEDLVTKTHRAVQAGKQAEVVAALPQLAGDVRAVKDPAAWTETCVEELKLMREADRRERINHYYQQVGVDAAPLRGYIMNWDNVATMHQAGISFGSHTHSHKILKGLPLAEIEEELRRSRDILAARLQAPVDTFCYPNARYNGNEREILARCGYRYAFRLDDLAMSHCSDPYYVPRFLMYEQIASNPDYVRLRLLEIPSYKARSEN